MRGAARRDGERRQALGPWGSALCVALVLLVGCGPSDPERAIPSEYHEPPPVCAASDELLPIVAMPWRRLRQTFLEAGSTPGSVLVDYDVWPRAHADEVWAGFGFDATVTLDPVVLAGECPARLDLTALRTRASEAARVPGDVVRLRVVAGDDDASRQGELFFTTGSATLDVRMPDSVRASAVPWLLVFEPLWGEPRLALRVVEPSELTGPVLRLEGLPEGGGMVGLLEVGDALTQDADVRTAYLPNHFAEDWPAYTRRFLAGLFETFPSAPIDLVEGAGLDARNADLAETPTLTDEHALGLLLAGDEGLELPSAGGAPAVQGAVQVPCGRRVHAFTPSLSRVTFHLPPPTAGAMTPPPRTSSPGGVVDLDMVCEGDTGALGISAVSENQRDTRLWLSLVTP